MISHQHARAGLVDDDEAGIDAHRRLHIQVRERAVLTVDGERMHSAARAGLAIQIWRLMCAIKKSSVSGNAQVPAVQAVEILPGSADLG